MADTRRRVWIHEQLSDSDEAREVGQILARWKTLRMGTLHLVRAIRLYAALLQGNVSLLHEYFPGIGIAFGRPAPARRVTAAAPVVEYAAKSEADNLADALDIGFGNIEL